VQAPICVNVSNNDRADSAKQPANPQTSVNHGLNNGVFGAPLPPLAAFDNAAHQMIKNQASCPAQTSRMATFSVLELYNRCANLYQNQTLCLMAPRGLPVKKKKTTNRARKAPVPKPTVGQRLASWIGRHRRQILLSALSGALLAAGFPTISFWPIGFAALAPFLWSLKSVKGRDAFAIGWWFGAVYAYTTFFWLNSIWPIAPSAFLSVVGIVALAGTYALYYAAFGWAASYAWRKRPGLAWLALPAIWVCLEWWQSWGKLAFPWLILGHTQTSNLAYIQMADLGGVWPISFCLAAINVLLVGLFESWKRRGQIRRAKTFGILAIIGLLIGGPYVYGAIQMKRDWTGGPSIKVGVSQPNIEQLVKFNSYANEDAEVRESLQQAIETTQILQILKIQKSAPDTRLYILPETSFTEGIFPYNQRLQKVLADLAKELNAAIFFGEDNIYPIEGTNSFRRYNSAWMATSEDGVLPTVYNKMRLVPFGESLPYFDAIPMFREKIVGIGTFDEGTEQTLFKYAGLTFGCGICFESVSARHMAGFVRKGAQFLVIITNDAWYVHSKWKLDKRGPAQHNAHSTLRAIETRRWLVRSANTGISRIVAPTGRTTDSIELNQTGFMTAQIEGRDGQTLYVRYGDWFVALCGMLAIVLVLGKRLSNRDSDTDTE
jgi:apolipoprotein N-acyltransferase